MATVNQLLSSESKSSGIPIEFEIVSQPRLRKENYENQLVSQPIKKISWYPNRKKRTIKSYITLISKRKMAMVQHAHCKKKMARNLSSPKRSKNFCWLECWRYMSTVVSPRLSDRAVSNRTFLLKAPASHPNAMISSSTVTIEWKARRRVWAVYPRWYLEQTFRPSLHDPCR